MVYIFSSLVFDCFLGRDSLQRQPVNGDKQGVDEKGYCCKVPYFKFDKRVIQNKPRGFHEYNNLQMNAFAVVSDSGTLPEESSFFLAVGTTFPAVCICTSTELLRHLTRCAVTRWQMRNTIPDITITSGG